MAARTALPSPVIAPAPVSEAEARVWRVVGAAVRGVSHERLDLPCQDAQGFRVLEGAAFLDSPVLLIALADGAGSAPFSDQGAFVAVEVGLQALETVLTAGIEPGPEFWEPVVRRVLDETRQAVLQLADETGSEARVFATTFTCAIIYDQWLVVGQIGDGAVVAVDENGEFFTATRLQRGEYANETHFLTQADALDQAVIDVFERPVRAVAVMSDGLIRLALKLPNQEPHAPFFQPLFDFTRSVADADQAAGQLAAFLSSDRVNARTDDDKSLVLAVRDAEHPQDVEHPTDAEHPPKPVRRARKAPQRNQAAGQPIDQEEERTSLEPNHE